LFLFIKKKYKNCQIACRLFVKQSKSLKKNRNKIQKKLLRPIQSP